MLVGREVECAIMLHSRQISRYHAKILVAANQVFVEDLHSSNGTYVNGKKIDARTPLALGDEVAFDEVAYRVTSRHSGAAAATVVAPPGSRPAAPAGVADTAANRVAAPAAVTAEVPAVPPAAVAEAPGQAPRQDAARPHSTRMLSSERREQIESLNRQFQKDVNVGAGPRLVVMTAPMRGQVFNLDTGEKGGEWLIGRDKDADIHIQEKSVSRDHARLLRLESSYRIVATRAANGVVVNGEIKSASGLRHNDRIQIGRITLVFKTDTPAVEPDTEQVQAMARRRGLRTAIIAGFAAVLALILALIIAL